MADTDPGHDEGPHEPDRISLSWCNSAAVHADELEDSVTVSFSVGDPRGVFTFTIRRVPEDAEGDLGGHLILHPLPCAGQPLAHMAFTPLHDGTFVVGPYTPPGRLRAVPPAA